MERYWVRECDLRIKKYQVGACYVNTEPIEMVKLADAQATVEALQARVRELEQPVYVCQGCGRLGRDGWLPTSFTSDELRGSVQCPDCGCIDREKNTARELAAICTKAQSELAQRTAGLEALQRVRDEFERERDQLHAALMEAKAALNIYRATLDATTPATMDAAETHDRMFNHADRHPEAL